MEQIHFVDACTDDHFHTMSRLNALGWRTTYAGVIPADYLSREITDTRWVSFLRDHYASGGVKGLILFRGETAVSCATYCPIRDHSGLQGAQSVPLNSAGYEGWGEICSFYNHPREKERGYGSLMMEELLRRFRSGGYPGVVLYVLRENLPARKFYEKRGFTPDGGFIDLSFPGGATCTDVRYVRPL